MTFYAATVFFSAFLLFLVQPILAKYILPWFGGGPGVWTTCLLFFQVLLVAGYGYAHFLAGRLPSRKQVVVSLLFLCVTIVLLPITPSRKWIPASLQLPTWHILRLLFASVGACYFMLAATSPILQSWFSRNWPHASPYRLYTLSNLGSLLAIAGYPLIIEPRLGLDFQTRLWSYFYVLYSILYAACAFRFSKSGFAAKMVPILPEGNDRTNAESPPTWTDRAMWLSLAALSAVMLLATTNQMCLDTAAIPLLWLLPMGLYLVSFIVCFHSERWYSRPLFGVALAAALAQTCTVLNKGIFLALNIQIASYCFTLFVCCMVCHGELVRLKPRPAHLTSFYLMIAAGGALGGVFVALIAPQVFKGYWELHFGLAGTALVVLIILFRDRGGSLRAGQPLWAWALLYLGYVALIAALYHQIQQSMNNTVAVKRNFFGVLKVLEDVARDPAEHRMVLMNGRIEHGFQFKAKEKRLWPTSYFGLTSGAGIALRFHPKRLDPNSPPLRVGVVGLGIGTLAAYGERGDYFRFYEINPDVLLLADTYFTYRKDCPAAMEVVLGDARISMERERSRNQSGQFDVLAIDAFSSDAIPVHLLTRECYQTYWYHLREDGILALHVSSRYFNLNPVIRSLAQLDSELGSQAMLVEDAGNEPQGTDSTCWILVTRNKEFTANKQVRLAITPWDDDDAPGPLFTDDYSNILRLLR